MEPMALGSPGSPSPSGGSSTFLPSFLMGESSIPTTPRNNTLSPNTGGRSLAFAQSPRGGGQSGSPGDFNRSVSFLQQRSLFGGNAQQTTPAHNFSAAQQQLNGSISGPPTQGLFDSLQSDKNRFPAQQQTPNALGVRNMQTPSNFGNESSVTDSYMNQSDFNRITSPIRGPNYDYRTPTSALSADHQQFQQHEFLSPRQQAAMFWVTVFGFPQTATNTILAHFSQCGTIVDKVLPQQGGNWVHLKFASRLECDKAVNYNERIIGNVLMIGVVYCKEPSIVDKENQDRTSLPVNRVRPLTHSAYHSAQSPTEVILSPPIPQRSTGIVNKAMDMLFGW